MGAFTVRLEHLPNLLTLSRVAAVAGLIGAACFGAIDASIGFALWSVISDVVDGPLARALGVASERGARLDSLADSALYLSAPWVALALFPWLRATEAPAVIAVFVAYALPVCYGMLKFRRLTSYHTTGARVAGVALVLSTGLLFITRIAWPLHVAVFLVGCAAIEEMLITHTLDAWCADVGSLTRLRSRRAAGVGSAVATDVAERQSTESVQPVQSVQSTQSTQSTLSSRSPQSTHSSANARLPCLSPETGASMFVRFTSLIKVRSTLVALVVAAVCAMPHTATAQAAVSGYLGAEFDNQNNWLLFGGELRVPVVASSTAPWDGQVRLTYHPYGSGASAVQLDANAITPLVLAHPGQFKPYLGGGVAFVHAKSGDFSENKVGLNIVAGTTVQFDPSTPFFGIVATQYSIIRDYPNSYTAMFGLGFNVGGKTKR